MPLNNILPQYQAEERSAQVRVHPVPMPNHMDMAGRLLSQAGGDILKASYGLVLDMKRRKDETDEKNRALLMSEKTAALTTDVTKRVTELMKLQGTEASGATARFETEFQTALNQHSSGLGLEDMRKFRAWANQLYLSSWKSVNGHEYQQTTQANVQLRKENAEQCGALYAASGDEDALRNYENSVYEWWRASGRSAETPEYEHFVREMKDQAFTSRVDFLLRQDKVEDALGYFEDMKSQMSPLAQEQCNKVLGEKRRARESQQLGLAKYSEALKRAGGRSNGGQFVTPEFLQAGAEIYQEMATSDDPQIREAAKTFSTAFDAKVKVMQTNRATANANMTFDLFQNPNDLELMESSLSVLKSRMDNLPDGILRDDMQKLYGNMEQHVLSMREARENELKSAVSAAKTEAKERKAEFEKNPARIAYAEAVKMAATLANPIVYKNPANPFVPTGSGHDVQSWNLSDEKGLKGFLNWASWMNGGYLTDKDMYEVAQLATNAEASKARSQAVERLGRIFNSLGSEIDGGTLALAAPWLLDYAIQSAHRLSNGGKITGAQVEGDIDQDVMAEMSRKFKVSDGWFSPNFWSTAQILKEAIDENGNINFPFLHLVFGQSKYPSAVLPASASDSWGVTDPDSDREADRFHEAMRLKYLGGDAGSDEVQAMFGGN